MQNREELRQKKVPEEFKNNVLREGEKYNFQVGWGGGGK
jgi:hypothetical protein